MFGSSESGLMILAKKSLSEFRPGKKKIGTEKKEQIFLDFKISFFFAKNSFSLRM
jgi:hypothetical protein